jgi:hypothetical protein
MKKQIILLLLGASTMMLLGSWELMRPRIVAYGGLNINNIMGSESWKPSLGPQLGVAVPLISCNESMVLRPELSLSLQGAGWDEDEWTGRTNLWYLNVPLVMRYQHSSGFFGEAGIQPGFLLIAKDKYDGESYDYKEYMKSFDLSIPIGVGYEFKNNLGVGIRVTPGLLDISTDDSKDRNFVIAMRLSYILGKE